MGTVPIFGYAGGRLPTPAPSERFADLGPRDSTGAMALEQRVLIWMCVLVAINQLGFGSMVPSLPLYAQSFGVSASAIGLAIAVYGLARFTLALPAGQLSDRLGRRPSLALGGVVSALGNLWCAEASSYPEFILARFAAGAGAGLILTTGQVVLADITTPERRGRTIAIYQGVFIFAVGIGPFPGGLLAEHFGLAAPFRSYGVASLIAAAVAWFAVGETRQLAQDQERRGGRPRLSFGAQMRQLAGKIGFVLASLIALMNAVARTGGVFNIIPVLGSVRLGLGVAQIGTALAIGSVMGLIVTYPAGMLVDYFGRKAVIVPATVISGSALLLFSFASDYVWFLTACIVWSVALAIGGAAPAAYAADSAPPGMNASAMSAFRMVGDFGYVLGPIVLGLLVDLWSADAALLLTAGLLTLVGIAFAILAPETYRGRIAR
jgi:MFS family permease